MSSRSRTDRQDQHFPTNQNFMLREDPPEEASIQLSQRQLDLVKQRKNERRSGSAKRQSQPDRRLESLSRSQPRLETAGQQPFRTRSNFDQKRKDPPSSSSMISGTSSSVTKSDKDLESQRALVRSMIGMKGSRRNVNPSRQELSASKSNSKSSIKESLRRRIFSNKGRPKSKKDNTSSSSQASVSSHSLSSHSLTKATLVRQTVRSASNVGHHSRKSPKADPTYDRFMKDLGGEVAGSHSQLAASFRSCITGTERKVIPARKRPLQSESVKLLGNLHPYLMDLSDSTGTSQMVSDKVYQKDRKERSISKLQSVNGKSTPMPESRQGKPELHFDGATIETNIDESRRDTKLELEINNDSKPQTPPATISKRITHAFDKLKSSASPRRPTLPSKSNVPTVQDGVHPETTETDQNIRSLTHHDQQSRGQLLVQNEGAVVQSVDPTPAKPMLRPISPVSRRLMSDPSGELKLTPPRLRPVGVKKDTAPPQPKSVPWANVSLKPVKREGKQNKNKLSVVAEKKSNSAPKLVISVDEIRSDSEKPLLIRVSEIQSKVKSEPVVIAVDELTDPSSSPGKVSPTKIQAQESEPLEVYDEEEQDDSEVLAVISLKPLSQLESQQSKVILGKRFVRRVQHNIGKTYGVVQWKVDRRELEPDGMTFSMPSLRVGLLLKDGMSKELYFENSEDCMRFVTTFFNASPIPPAEVIETSSTSSSVRLDSLNDEEQTVLERYRESRLSKPHEEAIQEIVPRAKPPPLKASGTASTDSELTSEERSSVDKYRNMLQKSLPIGAVQHRMALEGASSKVVDIIVLEAGSMELPRTVSTGELPSSPVSTFTATSIGTKSDDSKLSVGEQMAVKRYTMMLKNGVPPDAVRHKLTQDGASMKVVAAVFSDESDAKTKREPKQPTDTTPQLSPEDDAVASKYRRMLKMGIPPDAVQHKMTQDQINNTVIEAVVGSRKEAKAPPSTAASNTTIKKRESALTPEEEAAAAEYRKLLKRQVPREALQFRMVKEGVSKKVIIAVLGKSAINDSSDHSRSSGSASTSSNMINLHWSAIENAPVGSFWRITDDTPEPDRCDFAQLLERFQKKPATSKKAPSRADTSIAGGKAKLLDLTRSNNIAISLKSFKEFEYSELANILAFLDPCRKIRGERSQFLRDLLPTVTELRIITEFHGSDDRLVPAELWFRRLRGIKRLETKARVIRTMEMFSSDASEVRANFRLLGQVCKQVVESKKLQDVLKMVLHIGNVMNEGTRMGGASGFKFDSLLRLTQTKTADGKMTLLDYLVSVFHERDQGSTLELIADFPEVHTACRLLINDMKNEVKILADALLECRTELKNLEKDKSDQESKKESTKKPSTTEQSVDPRAQLFAAITARGAEAKPTSFQKREQFLAAMEDKKKPEPNATETEAPRKSTGQRIENNQEGGITRLRNFIDSVEDSFTRLEVQRDEALSACKELSTYCGESGGTSSTTILLDVLSKFVRNVESSVKKHLEMEKRKAAKAKKSLVAEKNDKKCEVTNTEDGKPSQEKSFILMVNDVLKHANPLFKEDFKKGRTLPDPSAELHAVYEREKQVFHGIEGRPEVFSPKTSNAHPVAHPSAISSGGDTRQLSDQNTESIAGEASQNEEKPRVDDIPSQMDAGRNSTAQGTPAKLVEVSQDTSKKPMDSAEVKLALEEISKLASIEVGSVTQTGKRQSLIERARDKRQQQKESHNKEDPDEATPVGQSGSGTPFESATARSARKKRIQMRMAR